MKKYKLETADIMKPSKEAIEGTDKIRTKYRGVGIDVAKVMQEIINSLEFRIAELENEKKLLCLALRNYKKHPKEA